MKGHVRKRGRKWVVIVELDRDANGKRRQRWHSGFRTKRQAEDEMAKLLNQRLEGTYIEPSKATLAGFLESWLEYMATQGLAKRTMVTYTLICRKHLIPALGHHKLSKLETRHIEVHYGKAQATLAARTVNQHHIVLNKALGKAVKWKVLARNPCEDADAPQPKAFKGRALEQDEMGTLLDAATGGRVYMPILLALCTGLRKGEILALKWKDTRGTELTVNRTLEQVAYHVALKEPKTEASIRSIELPELAVEALRTHRARQNKERLQMGGRYENSDLVFAQPDGSIWTFGSFDGMYSRAVKASGLGRVRFHDLRHTHATQLLQAGENIKVVSERLGHVSIKITLDIYSHVLPGMQKEAAKKVNGFMEVAIGA